jgi:hypothetical protein
MKRNLAACILRAVAGRHIALLCFFLLTGAALAQSAQPAAPPAQSTIPALLVSDIHFEPFGDPAKAPQLAAAPANKWHAILAAPPSPDQQQRFASLQQSCHARGADTSFALFDSSLKAMRTHAAGAKFVAVSGDLLSHAFPCEFNALFPRSTPDAYKTFVEKTLDYVIEELDGSFPGVPVFVALGNNDSDCGDYRLDAHSEFLSVTGKEVTRNFPASERYSAEDSFAAGGYYSVSLPAPIANARLLVLNDIFMSNNYATAQASPTRQQPALSLHGSVSSLPRPAPASGRFGLWATSRRESICTQRSGEWAIFAAARSPLCSYRQKRWRTYWPDTAMSSNWPSSLIPTWTNCAS